MFESQIACSRCTDEMFGETVERAFEDALSIGWERRHNGLLCDGCIEEEDAL